MIISLFTLFSSDAEVSFKTEITYNNAVSGFEKHTAKLVKKNSLQGRAL